MGDTVTEKCSSVHVENLEVINSESAENFQKFIYELFENNGVINDLRAYLRGHIVEVLRSAQTGEPPASQKHFTQRLELPNQALNILIVEYLLKMEYSYSLSVFISEIPLSNMVFGFSRRMMQSSDRDSTLKFGNDDIWSILNYLGIKCDSEHAQNIVEMYKKDKNPLLLCILQFMPMYKGHIHIQYKPSQESIISNERSKDTLEKDKTHQTHECKHYLHCSTCQLKINKLRERYREKKIELTETMTDFNIHEQKVQNFLKNIDVTERNIIDETFQQVKSVYEAEVEMMKTDEETRIKRSLDAQAMHLRKKSDELENRYKTKARELERNIEKKKRFLWGLARALRDQHQNIALAMNNVREETNRLAEKEESIKSQMAEAEQMLRQRGEDMKTQISNELIILEGHLQTMKNERENINKEKIELEQIKNTKTQNQDDIKYHYNSLKNEFLTLKSFLETTKFKPNCINRGTLTDLADVTSKIDIVLNNGHDLERRSDDRVKPKKIVNDLKKQKNVNFSQGVCESYRSQTGSRRSSASSEAGDSIQEDDYLQLDDERLRQFARQQRDQIEELTTNQARLQAELLLRNTPPRPRSASLPVQYFQSTNLTASTSNLSHGWRKGAGEELCFLANSPPRIVVPGDNVPFIGVARERHGDNRRYLINQWRSLRRRMSPIATRRTPIQHFVERNAVTPNSAPETNEENLYQQSESNPEETINIQREQYQPPTETKKREKSPKSVLREAKEKLKAKPQSTRDPIPREKSPNTVLREAKLRLKKLEIEAEAVEKSYLDFRMKREALKTERCLDNHDGVKIIDEIEHQKKKSTHRIYEYAIESTSRDYKPYTSTSDFNKYIQDYCTKYDIGNTHFKNKNATSYQISPIPLTYSESTKEKRNYLETPLSEFRKYYSSNKRLENTQLESSTDNNNVRPIKTSEKESSKRPLTPILKNGASRSKSPIQNSIDLSIIKKETPERSLKIKSSQEHSREQSPENKSSAKSLVISITDHSILKSKENGERQERSPVQMTNNNESMSRNDNSHENSMARSLMKSRENSENTSRQSPIENLEQSSSRSGTRNDVIRNAKHDKVKELQILKENIKKIYNLPEQTNLSNGSEELSRQESTVAEENNDKESKDTHRNLLKIELENEQIDHRSEKSQDLFIESLIDDHRDIIYDIEPDIEKSPKMTIIVSPKRSEPDNENLSISGEKSKSETGEKDKVSQYQASPKDIPGVQMQLELSNILDNTISELEKNEELDYPDDFSADVENYEYNSRSEDNRSPISMAKTSDDDNFWES